MHPSPSANISSQPIFPYPTLREQDLHLAFLNVQTFCHPVTAYRLGTKMDRLIRSAGRPARLTN
jgi:hypothetical protein